MGWLIRCYMIEMPSREVFCNSPWYELHIFWDGSYGYCCGQNHHPYDGNLSEFYNVKSMSITDWHNSTPMRSHRLRMQHTDRMLECDGCWSHEKYSNTSRRIKANQKSAIFTKQQFAESYNQSPNLKAFSHSFGNKGYTTTLPIDIHIDFGNYCNLACKMCKPDASSTIASQYLNWGLLDNKRLLGSDWTKHDDTWESVILQILDITGLLNIHLMGGETLITPRFEQLIDAFIKNGKYDVSFSFVTNCTIFKPSLLQKLAKFKRVGIELSIETLTLHNEYVRQGTDNTLVMENIYKYIEFSNGTNISVTVRPAISLLTIGYYYTLLDFCIANKLLVKSLLVREPSCLDVKLLPKKLRMLYKKNYIDLLAKLDHNTPPIVDFNESNPSNYTSVIKSEIDQCIALLEQEDVQHDQFGSLIELLNKWDRVYGLDARKLYPEFGMILDEYGYAN